MDFNEVIQTRRTIRKFQQKDISSEILKDLINCGRIAPSGANLQPVKYIPVNKKEIRDGIFSAVKWAGYTAPVGVPSKEEAPTAYIAVLIDESIRKEGVADAAYAEENIVLSAWNAGIGSCIIGAFNREEINRILSVPESLNVHMIIALGYPAQTSVYEDNDSTVKYYLDESGNFHVPKRTIEKISDFKFCN